MWGLKCIQGEMTTSIILQLLEGSVLNTTATLNELHFIFWTSPIFLQGQLLHSGTGSWMEHHTNQQQPNNQTPGPSQIDSAPPQDHHPAIQATLCLCSWRGEPKTVQQKTILEVNAQLHFVITIKPLLPETHFRRLKEIKALYSVWPTCSPQKLKRLETFAGCTERSSCIKRSRPSAWKQRSTRSPLPVFISNRGMDRTPQPNLIISIYCRWVLMTGFIRVWDLLHIKYVSSHLSFSVVLNLMLVLLLTL